MANNLSLAMDNSHRIDELEAKTGDLLNSAKDFKKDALKAENIQRGRTMRMKIMIGTTAFGTAGVGLQPLVGYFML